MKINIFWALLIITYGCNAQIKENSTNLKLSSMERFDKTKFETNKVNGEYNFTLADGSNVRQMENLKSLEYTEEIKDPVTPFSKVKVFFADSGQLKVNGERFYLFPIGKWQYFDVRGTLIKETDWDASYKFSIYDLAKMMMKMDIDIMKFQKEIDVLRSNISSPLYIVVYPVDSIKSPYQFYNLSIDGTTGQIIEKTIVGVKH